MAKGSLIAQAVRVVRMGGIARKGRGSDRRGITPRCVMTLAILSTALLLSACAAPSSYMGISFSPGSAEPQIQTLARHAQTGDKHAQLALGIAFEEGNGVPTNVKRARKLYRSAATPSGGTTWVYVPPTRKGGKGYTKLVSMGQRIEGLEKARNRQANVTGMSTWHHRKKLDGLSTLSDDNTVKMD